MAMDEIFRCITIDKPLETFKPLVAAIFCVVYMSWWGMGNY